MNKKKKKKRTHNIETYRESRPMVGVYGGGTIRSERRERLRYALQTSNRQTNHISEKRNYIIHFGGEAGTPENNVKRS